MLAGLQLEHLAVIAMIGTRSRSSESLRISSSAEPIHDRHVAVHEHRVDPLASHGIDGFSSIGHDRNAEPKPLELFCHQKRMDFVVLANRSFSDRGPNSPT